MNPLPPLPNTPLASPEETPSTTREPVLGEAGLLWARRGVWLLCAATYTTTFVGSLLAGTSDLMALGRAFGLTLVVAILGRICLGLISQASQPLESDLLASQPGTLGSRVDLSSLPNLSQPQPLHNHEAEAA